VLVAVGEVRPRWIRVGNERLWLDTAEERALAARRLREKGLEKAPIHPGNGSSFCADGLFCWAGVPDANALMMGVAEEMRHQNANERAPQFMGYTEIPPRLVVRSVTEKVCRVEGLPVEQNVAHTRALGRVAWDFESLEREFDSWAQSTPRLADEYHITPGVRVQRTECL
jgi:hypothetical protein